MDIQHGVGGAAQRLDDRRADGDIRDEVAVHDVDMHVFCARIDRSLDVARKVCKVRRQNGRGKFDFHGNVPPFCLPSRPGERGRRADVRAGFCRSMRGGRPSQPPL